MPLLALCSQSDSHLCQKVMVFLGVPCSGRVAVVAQSVAQACHKDGKLVIGRLVSGKFSFAQVLPLVCVSSVRELVIHGPNSELSVVVLALLSPEWCQLEHISIQQDTLSSGPWQGFLRALRTKRHIRSLKISECRISADGVEGLATYLRNDVTLIEFAAAECQLQDSAFIIFDALANHLTIKAIDMSCNSLGDQCGNAIATMLSKSSTVSDINVAGNGFNNSVSSMFDALVTNSTVQAFNFSMNQAASQQIFARSIKNLLSQNTTLKALALNDCYLLKENARTIIQGLTSNSTLTSLSLAGNKLYYDGTNSESNSRTVTDELASVLVLNNTLVHLDLSRNDCDNLSLSRLCMVLAKRNKILDMRL